MSRQFTKVEVVRIHSVSGMGDALDPTKKWHHAFLTVRLGLIERKITFATEHPPTWKVGDEITLADWSMAPDMDRISCAIGDELSRYGSFQVGEDHLAKSYVPRQDQSEGRAAYLTAIFELSAQCGYVLHLRGDDYMFFLDDDGDAQAALQIGFLFAEYQWKFQHEPAALAAYRQQNSQTMGREAAARARRRQGTKTRRNVERCMRKLLETRPELRTNDSKLAEEITNLPDAPKKLDGSKLTAEGIRSHLKKIRAEENAGKSS